MWKCAGGLLAALACMVTTLAAGPGVLGQTDGTADRCIPISQRGGTEFGCFIVATQVLSQLARTPVFWYLDGYPTRAAAEAAKGPRGAVVESLGRVWLFTIEAAGWRPSGGGMERFAEIGPLSVKAGTRYTAQYMEAVFQPGTKSTIRRHSGPEAFYTLTGETCLETPEGMKVGPVGKYVIAPGGSPMELVAVGSEVRRSLELILQDS